VATLLVAGHLAVELVERHFQPAAKRKLSATRDGRTLFGRWGTWETQPGEEIVVSRLSREACEIHCHGGEAAARAIITTLVADGCQECPWQTWLRATASDPVTASAQVALAAATTKRTSSILLDQYCGALRREMETIISACATGDCKLVVARLKAVNSRSHIAAHLTKPWRVVLAGRPNVGKSSLMNAILGYSRAIVFDAPGTTRDVLTATTAIDGWPLELCDTAGLRAACEEVETEGVARAHRVAATADLLVLVFDATERWSADDEALCATYPQALIVVNKIDIQPPPSMRRDFWAVSCVTKQGISLLLQAMVRRLIPIPLNAGDALAFTSGQQEAICAALLHAEAGALALAIDRLREEFPAINQPH
jgi:tRNA modification GTPase